MIEDHETLAAPELLKFLMHYRGGPIWDGNVPSKQSRDKLHDMGLIDRAEGFQFLTIKGVTVLHHMGLISQDTWRKYQLPAPNGAHLCDVPKEPK